MSLGNLLVGGGVLVLLTFGGRGVVQNRESPDFRSPVVGRYDVHACTTVSVHYYSYSGMKFKGRAKQALCISQANFLPNCMLL